MQHVVPRTVPHQTTIEFVPSDPPSSSTPLPTPPELRDAFRVPKLYPDFAPGERFAEITRIGRGGFGVVYRARDTREDRIVALKTIPIADPGREAMLKDEYRKATKFHHESVVRVLDLFVPAEGVEGQPYFSMDFIEGQEFCKYLRERAQAEEMLNRALGQLASGLAALHAASMVHGDIKPSNILVTTEGRVVIVDLGLAIEVDSRKHRTGGGTPAYSAPEFDDGGPPTFAGDMYAVGVTLFEALTGTIPFQGSVEQIRAQKRFAPPEPKVAGRAALTAMCAALLQPDAAARPTAADLLRVVSPGTVAPPPRSRATFVGRAEQLSLLHSAYQASRMGTVAVLVRGRSGMGKTSLIRHFREQLQSKEVLFLGGRCLDRQSGSYRALDHLLDELAEHLRHLPERELAGVLPVYPAHLRLFRPFESVREIVAGELDPVPMRDESERRLRAFQALKELLARLSRGGLVLHLDDMQWSDPDSAAALEFILAPPQEPRLLLLATFWPEFDDNPVAGVLQSGTSYDRRELTVGPLSSEEARALAAVLLGRADENSERLADQADGNPFFLRELVRSWERSQRSEKSPTLSAVLLHHLAQLSPAARHLLEIVALAGGPIAKRTATKASGLAAQAHAALRSLQDEKLVESGGREEDDEIEVAHERVRDEVRRSIGELRLRECHGALALALEAEGADPERLVIHFANAGDHPRAASHARIAAERAEKSLAFERAAECYRDALEFGAHDAPERRDMQTARAKALANAGLGADSAREFLAAADGALPEDASALRLRATEQYLRSGWLDEGVELARSVLPTVGLRLAATQQGAFLGLMVKRTILAFRGLGFHERREAEIPRGVLRRIDTLWSIATGLALQDHIRAANLHKHHVLLALRAGEPSRIIRALSMEAAFLAQAGERTEQRAKDVLQTARSLAQYVATPETEARLVQMAAAIEFFLGRWQPALVLARQAEALFRGECVGMHLERTSVQVMEHRCLYMVGRFGEMAERIPLLIHSAQRREDYLALSHLTSYGVLAALSKDERAEARDLVARASTQLRGGEYSYQHFRLHTAQLYCLLYEGDAPGAFELIERVWPELRASQLLRVKATGAIMSFRRGLAALGVDRLDIASEAEREIERGKAGWAQPLAELLRAALQARRGEPEGDVRGTIERAAQRLDAGGMAGFAAAARRRLGEFVGGTHGEESADEADKALTKQGVAVSKSFVGLFAPRLAR